MPWTDSHCHVPYEGVDETVIDDALAAGVTRLITVGTDAEQSALALDVARRHAGVWATIGLHPHDAKEGVDTLLPLLEDAARTPGVVVAIGECGLDYHYDHSPRDVQRDAFAAQIALAKQHDLALVIHTREAWDDTFDILAAEGMPARTVFHCFTGGRAEAERCVALGASLSFSGIVSFKAAEDVREAAAWCPAHRLIVETDAPYLAPVPHRGKKNSPAFVTFVGEAVAAARAEAVEDVEAVTWHNAERLFRLR